MKKGRFTGPRASCQPGSGRFACPSSCSRPSGFGPTMRRDSEPLSLPSLLSPLPFHVGSYSGPDECRNRHAALLRDRLQRLEVWPLKVACEADRVLERRLPPRAGPPAAERSLCLARRHRRMTRHFVLIAEDRASGCAVCAGRRRARRRPRADGGRVDPPERPDRGLRHRRSIPPRHCLPSARSWVLLFVAPIVRREQPAHTTDASPPSRRAERGRL